MIGKEIAQVLDAYGLKAQELRPFRSVTKVETTGGVYALKKSRLPTEQLSSLLRSLFELSRLRIDTPLYPLPDKAGRLFIPTEEGNYLLTPWVVGRSGEDLLTDTEWVPQALERLARIHRTLREEERIKDRLLPAARRLVTRWNKRMKDLLSWKEIAARRIYPSPVDVVLMANVEELMDMASQATTQLEEAVREWENKEEGEVTFCHGRLSPEHIVMADHPYFLNFDHASYDLPIRDLIFFLRQILRTTRKNEELSTWLTAYLSKNELDAFQRRLLPLSFLYPINVTRFLEQYYTQAMTPSRHEIELVPHLERLLDEQAFFKQVAIPSQS